MKRIVPTVLAALAAAFVLIDTAAFVNTLEPEPSDYCRGLEMFGGVDAFIDYMNEDNPTPMDPQVEAEMQAMSDNC